jgi:hypothetical protein
MSETEELSRIRQITQAIHESSKQEYARLEQIVQDYLKKPLRERLEMAREALESHG